MKSFDFKTLSYKQLDEEAGIPSMGPPPKGGEDSLVAWYRSIRETPLGELGIGNLCRACIQRMHLSYTIPLIIGSLRSDPLAGEIYEGEAVFALQAVSRQYWLQHDQERGEVLEIITRAFDRFPSEVKDYANILKQKLNAGSVDEAK